MPDGKSKDAKTVYLCPTCGNKTLERDRDDGMACFMCGESWTKRELWQIRRLMRQMVALPAKTARVRVGRHLCDVDTWPMAPRIGVFRAALYAAAAQRKRRYART